VEDISKLTLLITSTAQTTPSSVTTPVTIAVTVPVYKIYFAGDDDYSDLKEATCKMLKRAERGVLIKKDKDKVIIYDKVAADKISSKSDILKRLEFVLISATKLTLHKDLPPPSVAPRIRNEHGVSLVPSGSKLCDVYIGIKDIKAEIPQRIIGKNHDSIGVPEFISGTLAHEIAGHLYRQLAGMPYAHGNSIVDADINQMEADGETNAEH
jgi:hypothetical protein